MLEHNIEGITCFRCSTETEHPQPNKLGWALDDLAGWCCGECIRVFSSYEERENTDTLVRTHRIIENISNEQQLHAIVIHAADQLSRNPFDLVDCIIYMCQLVTDHGLGDDEDINRITDSAYITSELEVFTRNLNLSLIKFKKSSEMNQQANEIYEEANRTIKRNIEHIIKKADDESED